MKNLFKRFSENLLMLNDEPVLFYKNKDYWISYNNDGWYLNDQTFKDGQDLLDNATIDDKLLSEIFDDVIVSGGSAPSYSEVKIAFSLTGNNMDFAEITELMGMQPTKTEGRSWEYTAFADENDNYLSVYEKMDKFAELMSGKEDTINLLTKNLTASVQIIGDPFIQSVGFGMPLNFIAFLHKTNIILSIWKPMSGDKE